MTVFEVLFVFAQDQTASVSRSLSEALPDSVHIACDDEGHAFAGENVSDKPRHDQDLGLGLSLHAG